MTEAPAGKNDAGSWQQRRAMGGGYQNKGRFSFRFSRSRSFHLLLLLSRPVLFFLGQPIFFTQQHAREGLCSEDFREDSS